MLPSSPAHLLMQMVFAVAHLFLWLGFAYFSRWSIATFGSFGFTGLFFLLLSNRVVRFFGRYLDKVESEWNREC